MTSPTVACPTDWPLVGVVQSRDADHDTAVAAGAHATDKVVVVPPLGVNGLACATHIIAASVQVSV
jgi:hypothetical protein